MRSESKIARRLRPIDLVTAALAMLLCTLCASVPVLAQTIYDGFNPPELCCDATAYASGPVAIQPDGKVLITGPFQQIDGPQNRYVARLHGDGSSDPGFAVGNDIIAAMPGGSVKDVQVTSDGRVLIAGSRSTSGGAIAYRDKDGASLFVLDRFSVNGGVNAARIQSDGKIIVAGEFTSIVGVVRVRIARLNASGSPDPDFDPGEGADGSVAALAIQPDGRILVGGSFNTVGGQPRRGIARLNADGTVDPSFDPGLGANGSVATLAVQADGKVVIGGSFTRIDQSARSYIARLNPDGSLDSTFGSSGSGPDSAVLSLVLQPDGKVLVVGAFLSVDGEPRARVARLDIDGSLDSSYSFYPIANAPQPTSIGANQPVDYIALQSDGRAVISGRFTQINSRPYPGVARLNVDGTLDTDLVFGQSIVNAPSSGVTGAVTQSDGKLLLSGGLVEVHGVPRRGIARLNAEGSLDLGFDPHAGPTHSSSGIQPFVSNPTVQPDGKILITGNFDAFDGVPRAGLARLNTDGSLDNDFVPFDGFMSVAGQQLLLQSDGSMVMNGNASVNGVLAFVFRVRPDGSLDPSFDTRGSFDARCSDGTWYACYTSGMLLQTDGKVLVRSTYTETPDGPSWGRIDRLNPDGSPDPGFDVGTGPTGPNISGGANSQFLEQPDGKILVTALDEIGGRSIQRIARLNPNGSVDTEFAIEDAVGDLGLMGVRELQADGRILVAATPGLQIDGVPILVNRLNADGSLDAAFGFEPPRGPNITPGLTLQPDGRMLMFGDFAYVNGPESCCAKFVRLSTPQVSLQRLELTDDGRKVSWLRGGTGPEFTHAAFDVSMDGQTWIAVGAGAPILSARQIKSDAIGSFVTESAYQQQRALASDTFDAAAAKSRASTDRAIKPPSRYAAAAQHAAQFDFSLLDTPVRPSKLTVPSTPKHAPLSVRGDGGVVVSQVYGGSGISSSVLAADYIELFNAGSGVQNLNDWTLQFTPERSGENWSVIDLAGVSLQPGQYYLVQIGDTHAQGDSLPTPDASHPGDLTIDENRVALVASADPLFGLCPLDHPDDYPDIADFVGTGRIQFISCFAGSPGPEHSYDRSVLRHRGGCAQQGDNGVDFYSGIPRPRNTSSEFNDCSEDAFTISVVSGTPQSVSQSSTFPEPLKVRVTDHDGVPQGDVPVTFYAANLNIGLSAFDVVTDENGEASVIATAVGSTADLQVITAVTQNAESAAKFELTILQHIVTIISGSPQTAVVGTAFANPLIVRMTDENQVPSVGKGVMFFSYNEQGNAGAVLSADIVVTDENGEASVTAIANSDLGAYQVYAMGADTWSNFPFFDLANIEDVGSSELSIEVVSGTPQSAALNGSFNEPLRVRITNQDGDPVEEIPVHFEGPGQGASAVLSALIAVTDSNGEAFITASANAVVGSYAVSARLGGGTVTPVNFQLANVGQTSVSYGNGQSTPLWNAFGGITVQVTGAGQPLANIPVSFSVPGSGPSAALSASTVTTDSAGNARFTATANGIAGSYAVTANIAGSAPPAAIQLTNLDPAAIEPAWLGWSIGELHLPRHRNVWIRARGFTAGGSIHESVKVFYPSGGYTATPVPGSGGRIEPSIPQGGEAGDVLSFSIVPAEGYGIAGVSGCGGALNGSTYLTGPLSADCDVVASFSGGVIAHTVTSSAGPGGAIAPSGPQTVTEGDTVSFVLLPNVGQQTAAVTGTCGGDLGDDVFTTAPVMADCSVQVTFEPESVSDDIFASGFDAGDATP